MKTAVKAKSIKNNNSSTGASLIDVKLLYDIDSINKHMMDHYHISNVHMLPKIKKVVLSMRFSRVRDDKKAMDSAIKELELISGQKPKLCKAKKSIATFKVKEGDLVGCSVTLRNKFLMYSFIYKLTHVCMPQIYDFRGIQSSRFDSALNLSFGIKDFLVFPELNYESVNKIRGLDVSIETSGLTSKEMAIDFMRLLSFPIKDFVR